jgi:5-amino-6-(5-phospho-D-ribitylamino)uracil phosphatase
MKEFKKRNNFKMVMFDIDGVLNAHGGNIEPESKKAIDIWRQNGYRVGFASGKHAWYIQGGLVWSGLLADDTLIVAENGGVVFNPNSRKKIIADKHLNDILLIRNIFYNLYKGKDGYLNFAGLTVWEEPKESLFCLYPENTSDVGRLAQILKEIIDINEMNLYVVENPDSVDILQSGVNKASGIEVVCSWESVSFNEIIAFGDSYNDKEMLEEVGFAITLENAKPEIKSLVKSKKENGFIATQSCGKGVLEATKHFLASTA